MNDRCSLFVRLERLLPVTVLMFDKVFVLHAGKTTNGEGAQHAIAAPHAFLPGHLPDAGYHSILRHLVAAVIAASVRRRSPS